MRISAIEPLAVLSSTEADLLDELLEGEHPDIDRATLAVYVVTTPEGGSERVVAPASEALEVGMTVIATDFTATAVRLWLESGKEQTVSLASELVLHHRDY